MSKTLHRNLQAKMDALQGPEWESSDEEDEEIVTTQKISKKSKPTSIKETSKKTVKVGKKSKDSDKKEDEREKDATVVYIGHLPNEFEERDLKNFLQQFGNVINIRISRSVKTGNSRCFAFVRWDDAETARIVADTLQGYFVGQRRLVCHPIPNPPKHMFYDTDKVIQRRKLRQKAEQQKRKHDLVNVEKMKQITARLLQREQKKRAKLEALGIDYDFPGYEASQMEVEVQKGNDDNAAAEDDKAAEDATDDTKEGEKKALEGASKKKTKRKDSVDSVGSTSSSSSRKRKDSVGSLSSAAKKTKRKDSVESQGSIGSAGTKAKKDRENSMGSESSGSKKKENAADDTTPVKNKATEKLVQSERKSKKAKKSKKRRQSAP